MLQMMPIDLIASEIYSIYFVFRKATEWDFENMETVNPPPAGSDKLYS